MRRLLRWTFNALAAASLLLCLATAGLWVRSYWVCDQFTAIARRRRTSAVRLRPSQHYRIRSHRTAGSSAAGSAGPSRPEDHPTPPWEFKFDHDDRPFAGAGSDGFRVQRLDSLVNDGYATPRRTGHARLALVSAFAVLPAIVAFRQVRAVRRRRQRSRSASAPPAGTTSVRRRSGARNVAGCRGVSTKSEAALLSGAPDNPKQIQNLKKKQGKRRPRFEIAPFAVSELVSDFVLRASDFPRSGPHASTIPLTPAHVPPSLAAAMPLSVLTVRIVSSPGEPPTCVRRRPRPSPGRRACRGPSRGTGCRCALVVHEDGGRGQRRDRDRPVERQPHPRALAVLRRHERQHFHGSRPGLAPTQPPGRHCCHHGKASLESSQSHSQIQEGETANSPRLTTDF